MEQASYRRKGQIKMTPAQLQALNQLTNNRLTAKQLSQVWEYVKKELNYREDEIQDGRD